MSLSSDEEDNYLGTKKFGTLQAQFNNFYQTKKLEESQEKQPFEKFRKLRLESHNTSCKRSKRRKKNTNDDVEILITSSDDEPIKSTISFKSTESSTPVQNKIVGADDNVPSNKFMDTDDVLKHLDKLAETAKELFEDYNAAICGNRRKKCKSTKPLVAPMLLDTSNGKKGRRPTRNAARLARLRTQKHLEHFSNCNSSYQPNQQNNETEDNSTYLIDTDSDVDTPTTKRLRHIEVTPNSTVQINVNWRCDSEITHTIAVFKFQCLSYIEEFCCKEYNIDPKLLLFTIEDKPVNLKEHCYASLRLTEATVIDGGVLPESYLQKDRPQIPKEIGLMKLKVQYLENSKTKDFPVHVRRDDSFEIIFWLIIKKLDCEFENISLHCDGAAVKIHDRINLMDLEEEDCLDLTLIGPQRK